MSRTSLLIISLIMLNMAPLLAEMKVDFVPKLETESRAEKGYSVLVPHGWNIEHDVQGKIDLIAVNLKTGQSVSVIVTNQGKPALKDFVDEGIKQVRSATSNFQLVDRGISNVSGHEAVWVLYTGALNSQRAKILQVFTYDNSKAYVITFGALEQDFDITRPYFEDILNSFKFLQ